MNLVFNLHRLQKIDLQIDAIVTRSKQITQILESDQSIQEAKNAQHTARMLVEQSHRKLRSLEEELKSLQIKKETDESSLYGGKIQNPKELKSLQDEIESLRKRISHLEDQILDAMEKSEQAEDSYQKAEKLVLQTEAAFAESVASLLGEQKQLQKQKENLEAERATLVSTIPNNIMENYTMLRKQKRGIAIASNEDGACSVCGAELRPEEIQASRSPNQIVCCSSCGRILYSG